MGKTKGWPETVRIGQRQVGANGETYIIAEAGVNHNGDLSLALAMVEAAAAAGADAVKFQAFDAERLVTHAAGVAGYQPGSSQREMLARLQLHPEDFCAIAAQCAASGIDLLITPFGPDALEMVLSLDPRAVKVASTDITNHPFLEAIGATHLPVILSTGASNPDEIAAATDVLAGAGCGELVLLQCVSSYPTPPHEANLLAIRTLAERFGVPVGYSDHTTDLATGQLAVEVGACVLEKHFTLDPTLAGPDQAFSLRPVELVAYIARARSATRGSLDETTLDAHERGALGSGVKQVHPIEQDVRAVARSSVTAAATIPAGTTITREMLTVKRPGGGIAPGEIDAVVGRVAAVDIDEDTTLTADMLR
ncbi:MAG: N-acetylneuraminate synthase family protein [Planctomycetota bacterium]